MLSKLTQNHFDGWTKEDRELSEKRAYALDLAIEMDGGKRFDVRDLGSIQNLNFSDKELGKILGVMTLLIPNKYKFIPFTDDKVFSSIDEYIIEGNDILSIVLYLDKVGE